MPRLRRSRPSEPGFARRRAGKGWSYRDTDGVRITDPDVIERIRSLVIPPAWTDVWICPWPTGHLQAVGTDDAGRRQYLYHPAWRERQDRAKHERVVEVASGLPAARAIADADAALGDMSRQHVLGIAFRLLDRGLFRVGGDAYAADHGSYGLATLLREHARVTDEGVVFDYRGKSGTEPHVVVREDPVEQAITTLKRRADDDPQLLAWREDVTPVVWQDITSDDINDYIQIVVQPDATAKDFRTWHGTVIAAHALAHAGDADQMSATARKRAVAAAMRQVAEQLGNTPAVARASYVDPRVVDLWEDGVSIAPVVEALGDDGEDLSPGARDAAIQAAIEHAVIELLTAPPQAVARRLRHGARRARRIAAAA